MSAGPIRAARQATTAEPIKAWRVGVIVIPDQHPPDCSRWKVVKTDGVTLDLEPAQPGRYILQRMRRHARTVRIAE